MLLVNKTYGIKQDKLSWLKYRILMCAIYCCMTCSLSLAQNEQPFAEILFNANKEFESGDFSEAMSLATSCSIRKAGISDQWKAHRLLALIYLADNQMEKASESILSMLKLNPNYKPSTLKDPAELIKMIQSFTIIPKFSLGFSLGSNTTFPEIHKSYVLANYTKNYIAQNSLQFGITIDYALNKNFGVCFGVLSSQKSFDIAYQFATWEVDIRERLTYVDCPLVLRFSISNAKRARLNLFAGAFAGILTTSYNDFESAESMSKQKFELENLNALSRRNKNNFGSVLGIGIDYPLFHGNLFLTANYYQSFSSITNLEAQAKYYELKYTYFYIDDNISLNNLAVQLGYAFHVSYKVLNRKAK